jgi:hypothetical protein
MSCVPLKIIHELQQVALPCPARLRRSVPDESLRSLLDFTSKLSAQRSDCRIDRRLTVSPTPKALARSAQQRIQLKIDPIPKAPFGPLAAFVQRICDDDGAFQQLSYRFTSTRHPIARLHVGSPIYSSRSATHPPPGGPFYD